MTEQESNTQQARTTHPKSISDDDICAHCVHCIYRPGESSACAKQWPGTKDEDDYIVLCSEFLPHGEEPEPQWEMTEEKQQQLQLRKLEVEKLLQASGLKMEVSLSAISDGAHAVTDIATGEMVDDLGSYDPSIVELATEWSLIEGPLIWGALTASERELAKRLFG